MNAVLGSGFRVGEAVLAKDSSGYLGDWTIYKLYYLEANGWMAAIERPGVSATFCTTRPTTELTKVIDVETVTIDKGRWERFERVGRAARYLAITSSEFEKISWQFPELTEAALALRPGDIIPFD